MGGSDYYEPFWTYYHQWNCSSGMKLNLLYFFEDNYLLNWLTLLNERQELVGRKALGLVVEPHNQWMEKMSIHDIVHVGYKIFGNVPAAVGYDGGGDDGGDGGDSDRDEMRMKYKWQQMIPGCVIHLHVQILLVKLVSSSRWGQHQIHLKRLLSRPCILNV